MERKTPSIKVISLAEFRRRQPAERLAVIERTQAEMAKSGNHEYAEKARRLAEMITAEIAIYREEAKGVLSGIRQSVVGKIAAIGLSLAIFSSCATENTLDVKKSKQKLEQKTAATKPPLPSGLQQDETGYTITKAPTTEEKTPTSIEDVSASTSVETVDPVDKLIDRQHWEKVPIGIRMGDFIKKFEPDWGKVDLQRLVSKRGHTPADTGNLLAGEEYTVMPDVRTAHTLSRILSGQLKLSPQAWQAARDRASAKAKQSPKTKTTQVEQLTGHNGTSAAKPHRGMGAQDFCVENAKNLSNKKDRAAWQHYVQLLGADTWRYLVEESTGKRVKNPRTDLKYDKRYALVISNTELAAAYHLTPDHTQVRTTKYHKPKVATEPETKPDITIVKATSKPIEAANTTVKATKPHKPKVATKLVNQTPTTTNLKTKPDITIVKATSKPIEAANTTVKPEKLKPTGIMTRITLNQRPITADLATVSSLRAIHAVAQNANIVVKGKKGLMIGAIKTSSLRSRELQTKLKATLKGPVATPGKSLHEKGLAIDLYPDHTYIAQLKPIMEANGWHQPLPSNDPAHFIWTGQRTVAATNTQERLASKHQKLFQQTAKLKEQYRHISQNEFGKLYQKARGHLRETDNLLVQARTTTTVNFTKVKALTLKRNEAAEQVQALEQLWQTRQQLDKTFKKAS